MLQTQTASRFLGYDHVDARVQSLLEVRGFYDVLMSALGLSLAVDGQDADGTQVVEYYEGSAEEGVRRRFFGIRNAPDVPIASHRVAFAVGSTQTVDRLAELVRKSGGIDVDGPSHAYQHEPYYAVFFRDPAGTPLEICYRPGSTAFPPRKRINKS